jgi:methylmalonyl-CoA mutase
LVPPIAQGIKSKNPAMKLFLAGAPAPEFKESYLDAGVDDFIHVRANCYEILQSIQNSKEGF